MSTPLADGHSPHQGVHSGAMEGCTVGPGRGAQWGQMMTYAAIRERQVPIHRRRVRLSTLAKFDLKFKVATAATHAILL